MKITHYFIFTTAMLFVWSTLLLTILNYYHEIRVNPCNICAEKLGEDVYCTSAEKGKIPTTRVYGVNGSQEDNIEYIQEQLNKLQNEIEKVNRINVTALNISLFKVID